MPFPYGQNKKGAERVDIDPETLERLCVEQCTILDLAGQFGVSHQTIKNRQAEEDIKYSYEVHDSKGKVIGERKFKTFKEIMEIGYARGRVSLRRQQMKSAMAGNATMQIWLGKQILDQRDSFPNMQLTQGAAGDFTLEELLVTYRRSSVTMADEPKRLNGA